MLKGFDVAANVILKVPQIKAAGYEWVGRYYCYNLGKDLWPDEAMALSAAGIKIVSIFEARGDRYDNFTAAQGTQDAHAALALAGACGQPPGSAIYFAVDFDATATQIYQGIAAYFRAVNIVIAGKYEIGVYGSGSTCTKLLAMPLVTHAWLAQSHGWAGYSYLDHWDIKQGPEIKLFGLDIDTDEARDDCGAWSIAGAVVAPKHEPLPQKPVTMPVPPKPVLHHPQAHADDGFAEAERLNREALEKLRSEG